MIIKPNYNASKDFFDDLARMPATNSLYLKVKRSFSFVRERLSQLLCGKSDEKMWKIYTDKLKVKANFYEVMSSKSADPFFSEEFFLFLAKNKFNAFTKEAAVFYFKNKIDKGEETLDSLKKKLGSRGNDLSMIVQSADYKKILSICSLKELFDFIEKTPLSSEWMDLLSEIRGFVSLSALPLQDKCEKKFIELFSAAELNAEGSWKICLGKRLVPIQESNLPEFAKGKLAAARKCLPEGFDEKVRIWQQGQSYVESVVQQRIDEIRQRIFEGCDFPSTNRMSNEKVTSSYIMDETGSLQSYKYTNMMPSRPIDVHGSDVFILYYLSDIIELHILEQCFKKYEGQISEEDFFAAYQNWGQFEKNPIELENLIEEKIAQAKLA